MALTSENPKRNIIFFGETGMGKSSAITLLLDNGTTAPVSNDSQPCTQVCASYETTLNGTRYRLWDTRGLGEGHSFLRDVFGLGTSSEKGLKKFLKERHQRQEIDLLVYCVRGSRATEASVGYYNNLCVTTRQLVAPVAILVTDVEGEPYMESWWSTNVSCLEKLGMKFDAHACISTLPGDVRTAGPRKKLADMITRKYRWQVQRSGSYFGSPVQGSTSAPPHRGAISSHSRMKYKGIADGGGSDSDPVNPTVAASTRSSSYHTAESSGSSVPSGPVIEPPTPSSVAASAKVPPIDTDFWEPTICRHLPTRRLPLQDLHYTR